MVGKLAQVAVDRTIGTVLGGTSGFGAYVGYKCETKFNLPLYSALAPLEQDSCVMVVLCLASTYLMEFAYAFPEANTP